MHIRHPLRRPQAVAVFAALVAALALSSCALPVPPGRTATTAAAPSPTATAALPARTPSATARAATVTPTLRATASATATVERVLGLRYVSADGDGLFIRSKPDMDAKVKVWPDGTEVELFSQQGEWCRVRDPDGYTGYMPTRYLSASPPGPLATPTWRTASAAVMYVSADGDGVFIRSRPDREARLKVWPDGSRMTVLGQQGEWCYVRDPDGYYGYIPAEYLSVTMP